MNLADWRSAKDKKRPAKKKARQTKYFFLVFFRTSFNTNQVILLPVYCWPIKKKRLYHSVTNTVKSPLPPSPPSTLQTYKKKDNPLQIWTSKSDSITSESVGRDSQSAVSPASILKLQVCFSLNFYLKNERKRDFYFFPMAYWTNTRFNGDQESKKMSSNLHTRWEIADRQSLSAKRGK